jgi:hypothetical protein
MGLFRALAYAIDPAMAKEADKRQRDYDRAMGVGEYGRGPGLLANWRAARWGNRYWNENDSINRVMDPYRFYRPPSRLLDCGCGDRNCPYNQGR